MTARYAVYYAPGPDTPLWRFGRAWLGRCADSGELVTQPVLDGIEPALLHAVTAAPRLYGWHATLKPPFALRAGATAKQLLGAVSDLARVCPTIETPALKLTRLGDCLALIPERSSPVMTVVAALCVEALDGFRAPPDESELQRRRAGGLTPRQETLLARWGYPYVMDEYRFHMTLTGALAADPSIRLEAALHPLVAPFAALPLKIDQLAVFRQDAPGSPLTALCRVPLAGASASSSATKRASEDATGASLSNGTPSGPSGG